MALLCAVIRSNRWRKRGIALTPTMLGVGFYPLFCNNQVWDIEKGKMLISLS